jgi:hypothetical protein
MLDEQSIQHWLPIDLLYQSSGISVRWMEFGSTLFNEPFFHMTVERLRSPPVLAREWDGDLRSLLTRASELPPVTPNGVIFHVSRCGSTLLANALRTAKNAVVLSEARPIGALFGPEVFRRSPFDVDEWEGARKMLLDCMLSIYGNHSSPDPKPIIKCNGTNILHMSIMRAVWPEVPFLILIRKPADVVISVLDRPAGWVDLRRNPAQAAKTFGWEGLSVEEMSAEEYCARVVGRYCEAALYTLDDKCRVLDYENINNRRVEQVADFFHLDLPVDSEEFRQVMGTYSKDPAQARTFQPEEDRKQKETRELIRVAAEKWADPHYDSLKSLQSW